MSNLSCSEQPIDILDPLDEYLAVRSVARLLITASTSQRVEIVARRIHTGSRRAARPFVRARARDLSVAPGTLRDACSDVLETGAGGSVLLSDVEEMPVTVQEHLIGLLEEEKRGRDPSAAVRLVSGSTVSLLQRVRAGTFSAQLFYRLNVIHVVARYEAI
jgi:two-component system C4-dicarboxylate transport response regulator DctD